ncbi:GtrA family protein [Mesorhizobium sp. RP14(2022)]|uniref:GtrA family protein n=1 Tax=Mesorhizobium liriopis TaxID=2953882 RepID=A0ABT1C5H9_9HYPH|nr:GtrA family protein [Mesorhizobium liriopis]MCO6049411.1 GtrA family protein [Mesorhizobium liriopis]
MMNSAVTRAGMGAPAVCEASPHRHILRDAGLALLVSLLITGGHALAGFPSVWNVNGDNDSIMRIVEVRDWLNGQNWFDLQQYRMGLDGGFLMHWSRLVDAPIALLMLLGDVLTGSVPGGNAFAQIVWPTLMFGSALFLILRLARTLNEAETLLPALVIGASALHSVQVFRPGALDHHNLQFVMLLVAMLASIRVRERQMWGGLAGITCAIMLGIGMETAPHVAALCLFATIDFLWRGEKAAAGATAFGLGLAGASAAIMAGTVPYAAWTTVACDAFSLPQAGLAVAGGLGLALVASVPGRNRMAVRLGGLGAVGVVCAALLLWRFPECLADPYAGLDPRLRHFWLDSVGEAQPFWRLAARSPATAAGAYMTPLVALLVLGYGLMRDGISRTRLLVMLLLGVSFAVSLWQLRGSYVAIPLAAAVLAAFVARIRLRGQPILVAVAWIISIDAAWAGLARISFDRAASPSASSASAAPSVSCEDMADYAELARLPPTRVLAVSNLGSAILAWTPHAVLAGPYHRNIAGNLAGLEAWMAEPDTARAILQSNGVGLVAWCAGNVDSDVMAAFPNGLAALVRDGRMPDWLQPVQETPQSPLKLFRVIQRR